LEKWHGRPAREITRKMRVPQLNWIRTESRRKGLVLPRRSGIRAPEVRVTCRRHNGQQPWDFFETERLISS